jgi:hypothetical protein
MVDRTKKNHDIEAWLQKNHAPDIEDSLQSLA